MRGERKITLLGCVKSNETFREHVMTDEISFAFKILIYTFLYDAREPSSYFVHGTVPLEKLIINILESY